MSMDRRHFIFATSGVAIALGGAALTPLGRRTWRRLTSAEVRLGPQAREALRGLAGTDTVAKAFIAANPAHADPLSIEKLLVERLDISAYYDISAENFRDKLTAAIREDFRANRLCESTEWVLSETECRAAAWRYLAHGETEQIAAGEWREGKIVEVENWGPRSTIKDIPVNVQSDGHSGLWFKAANAPSWLKLEIGGRLVRTFVSEDVVTSGLYGDLQSIVLGTPGEYPLVFIDEMNKVRQPFGTFVVEPTPVFRQREDGTQSKVFCELTAWGPQSTPIGVVPNIQPDGSAGFWFKIACVPKTVVVLFDGAELPTTIDGSTVTARLAASYFSAERKGALSLYDPASKESVPVGNIVIGE